MSDELNGAAEAAADTTPVAAPEPAVQAQEAPRSLDSTMLEEFERIQARDNPARAPDGKFASRNPADPEGAETAAPETADETTDQAKTEDIEPATPAIEAPQSWSAEDKANWAKAPPEVQQIVARREAEAHKAITQFGQQVKAFEPVRNVLERYDGLFRANGVSYDVGLSNLMTAASALQQDAPGAIRAIAAQHGVDLRTLAGLDQGEPAAPENAELRSLRQELAMLKRQAAETSHRLTSREEQEASQRQATLQETVEKFAASKPEWAEIEEEVFHEIHALKASQATANLAPTDLLQRAYDRALKVTGKAEQIARQEVEAKRAEEAKKKAAEAKRVSSMNIKSAQGGSSAPTGTWEDTMRAEAARLGVV